MSGLAQGARRRVTLFLMGLVALGAGCAGAPRLRLPTETLVQELGTLEPVGDVPLTRRALDGQVVLVTFFSTWCFPCATEFPTFQSLQAKYAERGFTVVGVGMDLEGAKVLDPFVRFHALRYPVVVAGERLRRGESAFGRIAALPTTYLVGRRGEVLAAYDGTAAPQGLDALVKEAVEAERPRATP